MANGIGLWGAELAAHFRLVLLAAWQHGMAWLLHEALCLIFTILVSFLWDNTLFASKAKIKVF